MLTHFKDGRAVMVDVTAKEATVRRAEAQALVALPSEAVRALQDNPKGDAVAVAELAGIMAAKRTAELIPLCHPLPLSKVTVTGSLEMGSVETGGEESRVRFVAVCQTTAPTGVEMEALTAASVAALTLYDMLKAASKGIVIEEVRLLSKEGGASGPWRSP